MRQYIVTGMTCTACQSRVEKAVAEVPGISSVAVALLTNSMAVDGTASDEEIIRAVERRRKERKACFGKTGTGSGIPG